MQPTVQMTGLDFGTTTSAAVVAEGRLTRNAVTGRTDLEGLRERFRSEMVFTPFLGDDIDIDAVARQLDAWFEAGGVRTDAIFGGGALLTGLTTQRGNADALVALIRERLGDTLIATANDPHLESWLAFMGSAAELSRSLPDRRVINLDIGGGTTNLALGQAGEVLRTGCLFVGARHVEVEPGTYRIVRLSKYAEDLFKSLGIADGELTASQVSRIVSHYVAQMEAAAEFLPSPPGRGAGGEGSTFATAKTGITAKGEISRPLPERGAGGEGSTFATAKTGITAKGREISRPLTPGPSPGGRGEEDILTLSGGVGELVYAHFDGKPWPATTAFGDLGIDLARKLVQSKWADDLRRYRPASAGRATVFGLLRHSTEISGSTLYLPNADVLPLADVPILGTLSPSSSDDEIATLFTLAARSERGACVRVQLSGTEAMPVRVLGQRVANALRGGAFPANRPLVLLVTANVGKALGQYVSDWGALPLQLLVIDEVPTRDAQFARIGAIKQQVVPVSFYGLNEPGVAR